MVTNFLLGTLLERKASKHHWTLSGCQNMTQQTLPQQCPLNPPHIDIFMEKVKCQTEKATVTRAKVPAANWPFTIKTRLERQEVNLGDDDF